MGAALGSCVGSCIGSASMAACCACCSCRCIVSESAANLVYVLTIVLSAVTAVSLRYGSVDLNIGAHIGTQGASVCTGSGCNNGTAISFDICNGDHCKGYWAVYRIAFALSAFHLVLILGTACRCSFSSLLHRGHWFAKGLFLAAVLVGTLFAPNELFAYFAWVARFVAPIFLLQQLVVFIDFGYSLNAGLVEKDGDAGNAYKALNLAVALLLLGGSLTALGIMYAVFPMDCSFNPLAITTTLLFGLLNTALSISAVAPHGSLLCSALIFAYTSWLCYATLAAFPEVECNPLHTGQSHAGALAASCIVAGLTLGYLAYRAGSKEVGANAMTGGPSRAPALEMSDLRGERPNEPRGSAAPRPDQITVHVKGEAVAAAGAGASGTERELPADASYWGYHSKMLIIAMYMAMLLTDWGVPASTAQRAYSVGYASAWLQMILNWLCSILYGWTLIAPKACPGRSFD